MRLIDADALERDGWRMSRTVQIDEKTMELQTRKPTDFPAVEPQPEPCEDTISRQSAIQAAECIVDHHAITPYQTMRSAMDHLQRILRGMPSAQPKERWIPCSERLPEESGQYIITVKYVHVDGYEDLYAEHGEWDGDRWDMFCLGHCGEVEGIIAWMPLPEPYQGGQ